MTGVTEEDSKDKWAFFGHLLREWVVKNQPGCSAWKKFNVNFFDLAESTTYGDQLGRGLWILGSLGPPGQGPEVRGGHKWPFVTNFQILVIQSFFARMRSYWAQMMSPGLNFWNMVKKSGKSHMGLLRPPEGVWASAANYYTCDSNFSGSDIIFLIFGT